MKPILKVLLFTLAIVGGLALMPSISHANIADLLPTLHFKLHHVMTAGLTFGVMDTTRGRAAYERCKLVASRLNAMYGTDIIVNEDYFWSENPIDNQTSLYSFETWQKVMQTQTATRPLQKGVNDNDVFIAIGDRITIDHRAIGRSDVFPQQYPNPLIFTTGVNTGNSTHLQSIFNGKWSLQVGRTVYINGETTRKNNFVPETQKSLTSNSSKFSGNEYVELDPYPVLSGKSDNKLQLSLSLFTGWAGAALADQGENVITFEFTGITAQNAAGYVDYFTGSKDIFSEFDEWMKGDRKKKAA